MAAGASGAAIDDQYRMRRADGVWWASEGNGGMATYKAVGEYVTKLAKRPPVWVQLTPLPDGCESE